MELTPEEARRFFIDRVTAEAERQGISLSINERRMLNWSEVEPGCVADPELAEALANEISDEAYEAKVARLLVAAYERELSTDPSAKHSYREAYAVLKRGDYYLMVMVDQALGSRLRRWWQFSAS
ncbi:MAG TPA: hypothetical protein VLV86_21310 [Vicinamibacterales bacterium]|nr:hypothetical protein [Vicinamibacterales bacterium]